jgi:hypothetical protein
MGSYLFYVQGSSAEPYAVKVNADPFTVSCSCTAARNGLPCKHRKAIIEGQDPGIVKGDKSKLKEISGLAAKSKIFEYLKTFETGKAARAAAGKKSETAFKKYREARLRVLMNQVKTPAGAEKALEALEAAIAAEVTVEKAMDKLSKALHSIFVIDWTD